MADVKEIRRYLNVIKRAVSLVEGMLDSDDGGLMEALAGEYKTLRPPVPVAPVAQPQVVQEPQPIQPQPQPEKAPDPPPETPQAAEWRKLRAKHVQDLLSIDVWPEAVQAHLMKDETNEKDMVDRANMVLDMMLDRGLSGANFLDYGCGDGWITRQILNRGVATATGYDIVRSEVWNRLQGPQFTTTLEQLPSNNYDIIMLYDVLDHCEDPLKVMADVKRLLKWGGVVYVRCHPWTSKHGSHLYKDGLNKAYIHLFLTWEEAKGIIGKPPMFTRTEKNPMEAYRYWLEPFKVEKERIKPEKVHGFFFNDAFKKLLATEQGLDEAALNKLMKDMEIQFVDFVLTPKVQ